MIDLSLKLDEDLNLILTLRAGNDVNYTTEINLKKHIMLDAAGNPMLDAKGMEMISP